MSNKTFFEIPPSAGYGGRVFVNRKELTRAQEDRLRSLSCWGGHDKSWEYAEGIFWGYEFPDPDSMFSERDTRQADAVAYLTAQGYEKVNPSLLHDK